MAPILAAAIVLAFIAAGELISIWSRARVPSLMIAMLGVFIFAKLGVIPEELVQTSTLVALGSLIQPALMVHMGSLIPLRTIAAQWRAVIIALSGMVVGVGFVLAVVSPLFGFPFAVAGAGPLAGGILSTSLTTQGLSTTGLAGAVLVVPTLVLMFQSLPSMPMTNLLLRSYALHLRRSGALSPMTAAQHTVVAPSGPRPTQLDPADVARSPRRRDAPGTDSGAGSAPAPTTTRTVDTSAGKLIQWPETLLNNQLFLLFAVFSAGAFAYYVGEWTGISYSIWGLLLGIVLTAVGVVPDRVLERGNGFGIAMAGIIAIVIAPLMTASMSDVLASLLPMITILLIGMAGILVGGYVATRLMGWNVRLGMSVALTAMFGFPADYLIVQEVVRSTAQDEREAEALRNHILPPMLIGGFTTVSAGSIVIASVLVGLL